MTLFLYIAMILTWGSSWLAIAWQIADISPIVSVFYRFALAAIIMYPMMKLLGKIQKTVALDHLFFAFHGALLFSVNFICFYYASHYIVSGLIAIIFSLATVWNALNGFIFYREKPKPSMIWGILLGLIGLTLIFWRDIMNVELGGDILFGVGLSVLGVYFFSLGNMITVRNKSKGINSITSTSYGIIYGSLILLGICLFLGLEFSFEFSGQYLGALVFLSLVATIFGFTAYLALVERLGASRAAYILVITPLVALGLSTIFEDYQWSVAAVIGVLFIAVGNLIVQLKRP